MILSVMTQLFTQLKKNHPSGSFTQMAPIHRLDCQPEIGIFPVTGLDIEAGLGLALFVIEADLNHIEADLKLADLTVVAVTVTRGFETAMI